MFFPSDEKCTDVAETAPLSITAKRNAQIIPKALFLTFTVQSYPQSFI